MRLQERARAKAASAFRSTGWVIPTALPRGTTKGTEQLLLSSSARREAVKDGLHSLAVLQPFSHVMKCL